MKKFIVMALVASAAAIFQPAKAQVSVSLNIGTQPRYVPAGYYSDYYAQPVVHRSYYAPAPRYVYVERNNWRKKSYYKPARVSRSYYSRPATRYYSVKQANYKNYNKSFKHGKGHGKGRH
ncbi:MAG: hypothetical protein EOP00_07285 [Pedobacter sp.]|nr:MAG: hypothetical protein EOP00_07285 [Pedobacter sp.]